MERRFRSKIIQRRNKGFGFTGQSQPTSFSDLFTRSNGAVGNGWAGATWTISSGAVANAPGGAELLANPGAEGTYTSGLPANWTQVVHSGTRTEETTVVHGGAKSVHQVSTAGQREYNGASNVTVTTNAYYRARSWLNWISGAAISQRARNASTTLTDFLGSVGQSQGVTGWKQYDQIFKADSNSMGVYADGGTAAADNYLDDFSLVACSMANWMLTRSAWADVIVQAAVTAPASLGWGVIGIVCGLDNPDNPQNWTQFIWNGFRFEAYKIIGLTVTRLFTSAPPAIGWTDGEMMEIRKTGSTLSYWYNNIQMGTDQTISELASNTYCGLIDLSGGSYASFAVRKYTEDAIATLKGSSPYWSGATYPTGKAVVSFRFDGSYSQDPTVQGYLDARGFKGGFAIMRDSIGLATYMTLAQCLAIQAAGHEIMCHGGTSNVPATVAAWKKKCLQYPNELRMMGFTIDTFVQPGNWSGEFYLDDVSKVGSVEDLGLRDNFHAYEAYIVPVNAEGCNSLPWAAADRFGKQHQTLDQLTLARANQYVDDAVAGGYGVEFLLHTHFLDVATYMTTADYLSFLDHVKTHSDAGDLVVLTPTQQLFATPA